MAMAGEKPAIAFTKEPYIEDVGPQKLKSIRFTMLSGSEITKSGEVQVYRSDLYDTTRKPIEHGLLDPRMGPVKNRVCTTCDASFNDCPGHFGYLKLALPVFNVGYFPTIIEILKCICKSCARILLSEKECIAYLKKMRSPKLEVLQKNALVKKIIGRCKPSRCPRCGFINGTVKKANSILGIAHDLSKVSDGSLEECRLAVSVRKDSQANYNRVNVLNPARVLALFKRMLDKDCELLYLYDRPEKLIITDIAVPPVAIRPSIFMDAGSNSNEDDITTKLVSILQSNATLQESLQGGLHNFPIHWEMLQVYVAQYINSEVRGVPANVTPSKPTRGFVQRIKGKQGRFRGNLSGKRVEFTGRTVISPDPNLKITEVAIPILMAQILTYPERVSNYNIEKLRQCVRNGPKKYPGANFVLTPDGSKLNLSYGNRKRVADELKYGYVVERHLESGDIVLFNRQPSLHRMSIMSHRARIMPWRTLRFNESVCNPYNADFDGDEMNLHVPQTEEARTEALMLMGVQNNLCTPKNGEILVASTQDFLTSSFLITRKDTFYDRAAFCLMCSYMGDGMDPIDLPSPAMLKPVELWTGKQLFSVLVRPHSHMKVYLNLTVMEKDCMKNRETMCPKDRYVYFRNSELICGQLGKATLALWWESYDDHCPELQKLAIRILSLTCSSSGCERNWSTFEQIHSKRRNRLEQQRLNSLVFVKYNLNLQVRQNKRERDQALDPICLSDMESDDEWITEKEDPVLDNDMSWMDLGECFVNTSNEGTSRQDRRRGNGNKDGLFSVLLRDYNAHAAAACMNRLAKLSARWIGNHGFSIGIDDVQPREDLNEKKGKTIEKGYRVCDGLILDYNEGKLRPQPGCDAAQTLEAKISGTLNKIREETANVCLNALHWRNSPLIMSQCGSKGSPINISQMIACVGQQSVGGRRAPNGFIERSLPHFPRSSKTPAAKGFVANSFYSGLTATEFFFHTMGGREGLVDTAVKTAETGYMSRRLMKSLEDLSTYYDDTVRDSSGNVVQLIYGDDGMDPAQMEGKSGTPLNLARLFSKIKATCPATGAYATLFQSDIEQAIDERLSKHDMTLEGGCSDAFRKSLSDFLHELVTKLNNTRRALGLDDDSIQTIKPNEYNLKHVLENVAAKISGISSRQLQVFLDSCISRYHAKRLEAGTAIGAIGAQSIGEPGTQMTLKTFHFAGVASMNVTLGVPRIKEIINASKRISTPIITAFLICDDDEKTAKVVKGYIEKTELKEVAKSVNLEVTSREAFVRVKLDVEKIEALQMKIDANTVKQSILQHPKTKIKKEHIKVFGRYKLEVHPPVVDRSKLLFQLLTIKAMLPNIIIKGIPDVERAVISIAKEEYCLLVEGTNLLAVMGSPGVYGSKTTSNHILEVNRTLGIEAARRTIVDEIQYTMSSHGMSIDIRHMMLLAEVMTYKGEVLGITRFDLPKMKDSVLMLASFEQTAEHLFRASVRGRTNKIDGTSECVIMGVPMQLGSGILKVKQKYELGELAYGPAPIIS